MSLLIQKPGILTTVQDLGRHGYRRLGINPGGAMDRTAARLANTILGNDEKEAVLEMHFPAGEILFEKDSVAAIGGADFEPTLGGKPVENWRAFPVPKGKSLKFGGKKVGNRAYLSVRGGLRIDRWLDSASTNLTATVGGLNGRRLEVGDRIQFKTDKGARAESPGPRVSDALIPDYRPFPTLRITKGAEFGSLDDKGQELLLDHDFAISNGSNRMGYRLVGERMRLTRLPNFISSAVSFGTIQTLPDGLLIVLMADHQTTGGYPRIAHVISRDLPLLAQLGAGDRVAFHLIEHSEAERLAVEFERELNFLRVGCRFQSNSWDRR